MPHDPTDFDFDAFLSLPFHERPRPKLTSERRPLATPRVVSVLLQQAYEYKEERKVTLTVAKDVIAVEHGFESWQHLKNLSSTHASIARKTPEAVRESFEIKTAVKIRLDFEEPSENEDDDEEKGDQEDSDDEDGPWMTEGALHKRVHEDENPPTEAVYFDVTLSIVNKIGGASREIGELSGYMYFSNERNSLFLAFDAQNQELADFGGDFEISFPKNISDNIHDLAYIEKIFVDEEFDEVGFGGILLKSCKYELGGLVGAIFSQPVPMAAFPNPRGLGYQWDRSRGRTKNLISLHERLEFKPIKGTDYLMWDVWDLTED